MIIGYIIGIIAGLASTLQASVNARIRDVTKSPYITTIINFITGISVLVIITLAVDGNLYMHKEEIMEQPAWILIGGLCGVIIVILGIICIPVIGSARNVMLLCFGQIMTGLLIDHYGLFGAPVHHMSAARSAGAALVIAGIFLISREGGDHKKHNRSEYAQIMKYLFLPVLAGVAAGVQVAANGTLTLVIGSSSKASLISMTSGLVNSTAITLVIWFLSGRMALFSTADGREITVEETKEFHLHWLMLFGGPLAVVIVGGNAIAAPGLGTGMVTIMNLIGMMGSGLIIDAVGFLGIEKNAVTLKKLAGMGLMLAGTVIITFM